MNGKGKGFIVAFVSVCVLVLFGCGVGFAVKTALRHKALSQVSYQLSVIDRHISEGHYAQAERLLEDLKLFSGEFSVSKEVLNRVLKIAGETKNYNRFADFAENAVRSYPKERDARSLCVYALLKTGQYDKAWQVASEAFETCGIQPSLLSEAALRSGNAELLKAAALDSLSRAAVSIAMSDDPNGYVYLTERFDDSRLIKNYVLALAAEGNTVEAFSLFDERIGKSHPVLGSYLAYDAGETETAYSYAQMLDRDFFLEHNRDWFLFLADLSMELGIENEAAALYSDFTEMYPDYSYVPYYNLAYLYRDSAEGIASMERGVRAFPGIAVLNLKLAEDYVKVNETEKAKSVLENFLKLEVDNPDAVLAYQFLISDVSPERFIGSLWNLYNQNRGINEKIPRVFLWYLTGLADSSEIDTLLEHCRRDYGVRSWIDFYTGVSAVLKEDFESAYNAFLECTHKAVRETGHYQMGYQPYYNCALLSLYFGYPDRALNEVDAARLYVDWEDAPLAASLHVLYGRIYLMKKDYEKAMRSFLLAHDLDPANIEVISYIDYLNSGIEK